ncbi:MAG TPA: Holliday junction branch migration protein RuvA [Longimicrobiales bacterium]|nr:Holliday junction branch migration protein RuvA [Longimicrobiales bacterium]
MISRLKGLLLTRDPSVVEVETDGGVVYEVEVPLTVLERLPSAGNPVELRTAQVVTETSAALYGFIDAHERTLFQRLITASGVGPKLALSMMSAYRADRLARAIVEKDLGALTQISGIGRKKAEKLVLELADKVADLAVAMPGAGAAPGGAGTQEAVKALVALGFSFADADHAVRQALEAGASGASADDIVRKALAGR